MAQPSPFSRRGDDVTSPPRPVRDDDADIPVLFTDVSWDDYDAMLRIRGERRFRITYDRGRMEIIFPGPRERFSGVSWDDYEAMLRMVGDGPVRLTFDRGELEVEMPSFRHESLTRLAQTLLTDVLRALRVPFKSGGSTTLRRQGLAQGLEPDLCFYLHDLRRLRDQPDPDAWIVPDLAIEVEVSRSSLNKLAIYAGLGVPEVWRFDGQTFAVVLLGPDRTYAPAEASGSSPMCPSTPWRPGFAGGLRWTTRWPGGMPSRTGFAEECPLRSRIKPMG